MVVLGVKFKYSPIQYRIGDCVWHIHSGLSGMEINSGIIQTDHVNNFYRIGKYSYFGDNIIGFCDVLPRR